MVVSSSGVHARLQRPLDFLVIADHAENQGLAPTIGEKNPELLKLDFVRKITQLVYDDKYVEAHQPWGDDISSHQDTLAGHNAMTKTMWERRTAAAERSNGAGRFKALSGYERTSIPCGSNLHRNVVFLDSKDEADPVIPFSSSYLRALEIPTRRWTTCDAAFLGVDLPEGVDPTLREHAYTSPIRYTPKG